VGFVLALHLRTVSGFSRQLSRFPRHMAFWVLVMALSHFS
jgi:hypothetical protein